MCCCSSAIAKVTLIIFNVVFFVFGSALFVIGMIAHFNQDLLLQSLSSIPPQVMSDMTEAWNIPELLAEASILLIVVGAFVLLVAFFGCCGAIKEVRCFLISYIIIVSFILVLQFATLILVIVRTHQANETVSHVLQESIRKNYIDSEGGLSFNENGTLQFAVRPIKLAWDGIQVMMGCCGAVNASDYVFAKFSGEYNFTHNGTMFEIQDAKVPLSCCNLVNREEYEEGREDLEEEEEAGRSKIAMPTTRLSKTRNAVAMVTGCVKDLDPKYIHDDGCYKTFLDLIEEYWKLFIAIIVVTMVIEVFGISSACTIMRRREEKGKPL